MVQLALTTQLKSDSDVAAIVSQLSELKDNYHLETKFPTIPSGKLEIGVRKAWESGQAGVYVDNHEVLRFRNSSGGISPYLRAKQVAFNLHEFLKTQGNPRDIKPGLEAGSVVIRSGESVLITIDPETAKLNNQTPQLLAMTWTNMIRRSLGVQGIERGMGSSRGMSGLSREEMQLPSQLGSPDGSSEVSNYQSQGVIASGMASWYGPGFHGRRCANGSRFDMNGLTAAHRTLPFGTRIRVLNQRTGKSCIVSVTDRGPFHGSRIIDLSKGAAQAIGLLGSGVSRVTLERVSPRRQKQQLPLDKMIPVASQDHAQASISDAAVDVN
ncbi:MAG: septal ring lytic transglycosylase RlpA family protein [Cyanobacteria bacterium]|nr:septal ring lytic transglycosylase RlpA family protein [Cyanobacteriota bacterium]